MKLGAQMYTVRDYTQDTDSLAETLSKIADIGYTSVQLSGTCVFDPGWMAEQLAKNGLICAVTHTNPNRIADETEAVAAEHSKFGCNIIGIGSAPGIFEPETFHHEDFRDRFLPVAKQLKAHGKLLGYHNHHPEFAKIGGVTLLELLAADFPADILTFILDTYWIQYGGGDPAAWIRRFSGRAHCVHLKDLAIVGTEQRMAAIGDGNINFDTILAACADAGTEYLLVEQDDCYGENPFDCLKRSYGFLKSKGLE